MSESASDTDLYTPESLAKKYGINIEQAHRHINRLGAVRTQLDSFLLSSSRTQEHRDEDIDRTINEVSFG